MFHWTFCLCSLSLPSLNGLFLFLNSGVNFNFIPSRYMASILRFRKLCYVEPVKFQSFGSQKIDQKLDKKEEAVNDILAAKKLFQVNNKKKNYTKKQPREWRCIDSCCWVIGYLCTTWWLLLLLYSCFPATLPGFQVPESPGVRLKREGLTSLHPVVLVPGIVTGGLELWAGKPCSEGLFRKRLWGGSFTEIFKRLLQLISISVCFMFFNLDYFSMFWVFGILFFGKLPCFGLCFVNSMRIVMVIWPFP